MDEATLDNILDIILKAEVPSPPDPRQTVQRILARRQDYGITRLGSITGLDWIGVPVVQVVRPRSRSVAVSQGKGLTFPLAAISGLMESLEGWASERIDQERIVTASLRAMNARGDWSHLGIGRDEEMLSWIAGLDLLSGRQMAVPLALVDTAYIVPSPHPHWIARDTTGLAAGMSLQSAVLHACLEILERQARCTAMKIPHFFDRCQIDARSVQSGNAGDIMRQLSKAGFVVGIWQIPAPHALPIYWCHIMEDGGRAPFAPLPAEGFGCDISHDRALTSALLEACQSRLGVISAARDDIRTELYNHADAGELAAWRLQLAKAGRSFPRDCSAAEERSLAPVIEALKLAGAHAAVLVVLHSDDRIPLHVVRVVAPPLETNPEADLAR
ncbi:YcaO-like family protein [Rhizobium lentis]|uniref:Ribosomal protein S12 methylthiotransferase accessory factor n=1 Tax=Rhizobium lentis TaxID=1138194 RepID=A0A7W8XI63_9HYPH|nr:YcaO-like family protein [Rhizobium lentis]MBB4576398.1 ribosomal protein S12 methylthiotransferase accessory factor [Rhizobium lentis]MBB5552735.1 ribosomal protein S12 methylthiotransferase accessory factor [Rhizobium lentis]MBB5563275.1 ribosomal protein S12 methylthiotransferase accessory factor [Rhizobium lentis]MBB5569552.1 ribosomal protein S12 methylthiotransferase accessory factor [Rhizobium lentis]